MAEINVPVFVDGTLNAGNIMCGVTSVTPSSPVGDGTFTGFTDVTGLSLNGSGVLFVQVTAMTMVAGQTLFNAVVSNRENTGFTVRVHRSNNTTTSVFWIATRNP